MALLLKIICYPVVTQYLNYILDLFSKYKEYDTITFIYDVMYILNEVEKHSTSLAKVM